MRYQPRVLPSGAAGGDGLGKNKQDPKVLFIAFMRPAISIIIAAVEAVMVVMMMVVMVVIPPIPRHHDHRRVVIIAVAPIEAVMVMMMVVVVIELGELNILARLCRWRFIDGLQQGAGVRNRLQQVGI
ncbi:hypothetical protein GCM10010987_58150 [Bradyrhizobium guangdongense]|uniref:Uncharacterized protein n=1 Tax=Bradyrhizobium guangdongense TaxID=1325090 RepID=A0AA87WBU2_9BRAD|nr:hypothetical protein GCM10010987_58150 [Bradyrhizobium guangdongense]